MAALAVRSCRDLILQQGAAPDGGTEVARGQNVAEIKQIGSEPEEKERNGSEEEEEEERGRLLMG